jgi:hypothetical protein
VTLFDVAGTWAGTAVIKAGIWVAAIAGLAIFAAAVWLLFQSPATVGEAGLREVIASEKTAKWAVLGVLGALLGNALLFLNLRIAAQATDAANIAATAAKEAVDHARRTSMLELRPYLSPEETNFIRNIRDGELADLAFQFLWRNVGATPARNVRTFIDWRAEDTGFDWNSFHYPEDPSLAGYSGRLGPNGFVKVNSRSSIPVSELIAIAEGRREIYLWGSLEYDGLEQGVRHRSEHSQRLAVPNDPSHPDASYWSYAVGRHDQSDEDCLYRPGSTARTIQSKPLAPTS